MASGLKRRSWGWLVWLVLLGAGGFYGRKRYLEQKPRALAVRFHRVERGTVRDLVSSVAAGRVAAVREASLRAEIAGTVQTLHHRRGERVRRGDPLLSYDTRELRDRIRVAQAAVAMARAQGLQAEASAQLAERNAGRARRLSEAGASPAAEADTLTGQAEVAARSVGTARVGLQQAMANVALAQTALTHTVLRAPFDGMVLTTSIEEGEVTIPGTPVISLADPSSLHVDAELDEADVGRVREGMTAEVTLDAFPGQRFAGTLRELAPSVTRDMRGNRAVAIEVALQPDPRLRVGMSADVDVVVAVRENVVAVPPNAVLGRGTRRAVFVIDEGNIARRRDIEVGVSTWEGSEVLSGLREGERVIVTLGSAELTDGVLVEARPEEHARNGVTR